MKCQISENNAEVCKHNTIVFHWKLLLSVRGKKQDYSLLFSDSEVEKLEKAVAAYRKRYPKI